MENYEEILKDYGLGVNETRVYLAMLKHGYCSVLQISKGVEIKRPTVYVALENLISKHLVKVVIRGKKKVFIPEKPKKLLEVLDEKKAAIQKILPFLENQYMRESERPKLSFFEGGRGIKKVYQEVMNSRTEALWFGSVKDLKDEFLDSFLKLYDLEEARPDFMGSREIVNNTKFDKDYAREIAELNNPKVQARVLPGELFFLGVDNIVYENKVVIISVKNDYFAVVIESARIAAGFRAIFELAWKAAVKP